MDLKKPLLSKLHKAVVNQAWLGGKKLNID